MQVNVEKLSPVLVEFQVTVPADRVKQSLDRAYDSLAKSSHIKGFRKGKAPRHVLAHLFGDRVASDVANKLVEDTLNEAISKQNVRPITNPAVEKPKPSPSSDFTYRARFEVTPDIDKVDYEGLEVTRPVYKVSDDQVDAEIEKLRRAHSTLQAPNPPRAAAAGDTVTMDFVLQVEGKPVDNGIGNDIVAEIGSSSLLPAISDALVGKEPGAEFDVEFIFPENYQRQELRGKPAKFHIVLKELKERVLPDLDDEFAKDVGSFENLAALRADVTAKLEKAAKERAENEVAEALVLELCKRNPIPVPPSLVQQQARIQEETILSEARRSGQAIRSLSPELKQRILAEAEVKVRAGLLMAEIAKKNSIQIGQDDITKAYEELAEQTGKNINKIKVQYQDPKQREILIGMILEDKVLNIIEAAAKITDAPAAG
jgi:trigger factor